MTPHQFTLDLLALPTPTLDNFVPGANGAALAALRELLDGRGPAFVHLWGPPGSGRSHLIAAVRNRAVDPGASDAFVADVAADAASNRAPGAIGAVPDFRPAQRVYAVDDVDRLDAAGQARLFGLQNAVRQHPGCFLVTSAGRPPAHLELRDDVRSRLAWGLVFALQPIAEPDQAAALAAYAQARGARVDTDLVPYMLTRLPRDMRTLVSVLDALDAFALSRQRALTVPLLREWLQSAGAAPLGGPARLQPPAVAPAAPAAGEAGAPGPAGPGQ